MANQQGDRGYTGNSSGNWNSAVLFLGGVGIGALLMYMLDPDRGRRRRALVRDKVVSLSSRTGRAISGTARDLSNRAQGLVIETGKALGIRGQRGQQEEEEQEQGNA
jgi:hypothetical protein